MSTDDPNLPPVRSTQSPGKDEQPYYQAEYAPPAGQVWNAEPQPPAITRPYDPRNSNPYQAADQSYLDPRFPYPAKEDRTLGWLLFSFNGRIPRRVYWFTLLGSTAVAQVVMMLVLVPMIFLIINGGVAAYIGVSLMMLVFFALWAVLVWMGLAVQVKRWHDLNKPGIWVLVGMIPFVGPFWVLIECGCTRGTRGPNSYGPDPT